MKFLIIKTSALGDIVHTFPAIQLIRKIVPDAVIDWVVEKQCAELIRAHPLVNKVIEIETKKWRKAPFASWTEINAAATSIRKDSYDVVFDFQGNIKSGIVMGLARGVKKVGFGAKSVPEMPNLLFSNTRINLEPGLNIRNDYLSLVEGVLGKKEDVETTLLAMKGGHNLDGVNILVCPGSNWENKRLSENSLLEFLRKIEFEKNCKFWITQNNAKEMSFALELCNKLKNAEVLQSVSLPMLQNWMASMDLVIAMDSLPLHLAAEANVPTMSIFGPSLAAKYAPTGSKHVSIQGVCPYGQVFVKRCPLLRKCKTGACMKNISAEELFTKFNAASIIHTPGKLKKVNFSN